MIKIGTRASQLALKQTEQVASALKAFFPAESFEIVKISTSGDRVNDRLPLPDRQGIFVREIEEALKDGRIDMAVHSLKDMPCDQPSGLELGAVLKRIDPRDALIAPAGTALRALRTGARIGTSSVRRRAQILAMRPDLVVIELRGNIDTRLRKLDAGEADALVIAAAGVIRLGQGHRIVELMPLESMLPAPCQGALAIEVRSNDQKARALVAPLNDTETFACIDAERALLKGLGGGCSLPVGALAVCERGVLTVRGQVVGLDGRRGIYKTVSGPVSKATSLGQKAAQALLDDGDWVRSVLRSVPPQTMES